VSFLTTTLFIVGWIYDADRGKGQSRDTSTSKIAKIAKPTVETSDKVRLNLEKFVWSSREK
jgi:hypothetical protein